jgi:hypothetical protein
LSAYKPNRVVEYSPQRGGILNFKLLFGRKSIVEGWEHQGVSEQNAYFCYMFLFRSVPLEFFAYVESVETFKATILEIGKASSGQMEEDHKDASSNIANDSQHRSLTELYQAISRYIAKQEGSNYGLWRLDDHWFAFDEITFLRGVKSETEYFPTPQAILYALDNLGAIPVKEEDNGTLRHSEKHQGIILPCLNDGYAPLKNGTIMPAHRLFGLIEKSVMDEILNHLVTSIGLVPEIPRLVIDLTKKNENWLKKSLFMSVTPTISDEAFRWAPEATSSNDKSDNQQKAVANNAQVQPTPPAPQPQAPDEAGGQDPDPQPQAPDEAGGQDPDPQPQAPDEAGGQDPDPQPQAPDEAGGQDPDPEVPRGSLSADDEDEKRSRDALFDELASDNPGKKVAEAAKGPEKMARPALTA